MESSFKINLKDASWWMSIKKTCKPGALVTTKLSKKGCIFLIARGRLSQVALKEVGRGLNLKNILLQHGSIESMKPRTRI